MRTMEENLSYCSSQKWKRLNISSLGHRMVWAGKPYRSVYKHKAGVYSAVDTWAWVIHNTAVMGSGTKVSREIKGIQSQYWSQQGSAADRSRLRPSPFSYKHKHLCLSTTHLWVPRLLRVPSFLPNYTWKSSRETASVPAGRTHWWNTLLQRKK